MTMADRETLHKEIDALTPEDLEDLQVFMRYLRYKQTHPGSAWFRAMVEIFSPVRAEIAQAGMTEDEINMAIDESISEVRRGKDS